jgi:hypothetical protein
LSEKHTFEERDDNDWRLKIIKEFKSFSSYDDYDDAYDIQTEFGSYLIYKDKVQEWKQTIRKKKLERLIK